MIDECNAVDGEVGEGAYVRGRSGVVRDGQRGVDCFDVSGPSAFIRRMESQLGAGSLRVELGPSRVACVRHSPALPQAQRQARREQVLMSIQVSGSSSLVQAGRAAVLRPGDLALCSTAQAFELAFTADCQQAMVAFPLEAVDSDLPHLHDHTARRLAGTHKTAVVLRDLVALFRASEHAAARASLGRALVHALAACGHEWDEPLTQTNRLMAEDLAPTGDRAGRLRRRGPRAPLHSALSGPSPRESDVLHLIARGCSYADAAAALNVSVNTVCTHVRSVYSKLGVHSKNEAVFEARLLGWLS